MGEESGLRSKMLINCPEQEERTAFNKTESDCAPRDFAFSAIPAICWLLRACVNSEVTFHLNVDQMQKIL